MVALKREWSSEREAADEKLVKKFKLEKVPTFRKRRAMKNNIDTMKKYG